MTVAGTDIVGLIQQMQIEKMDEIGTEGNSGMQDIVKPFISKNNTSIQEQIQPLSKEDKAVAKEQMMQRRSEQIHLCKQLLNSQ